MVEEIYSSCFIVTPPFLSSVVFPFSLPTRHTVYTRPPGRQVDDAPCRGYFSIVCCSSVPFHHQNHHLLLLFIFFKYINVMIQLCALNRQPWYVSGYVFNHIHRRIAFTTWSNDKLDSFFCVNLKLHFGALFLFLFLFIFFFFEKKK